MKEHNLFFFFKVTLIVRLKQKFMGSKNMLLFEGGVLSAPGMEDAMPLNSPAHCFKKT